MNTFRFLVKIFLSIRISVGGEILPDTYPGDVSFIFCKPILGKDIELYIAFMSRTGAVPTPRYFHSCAIHNGSMYVFGGYNGSDRLCDFFEHNFETGTWTELVSECVPVLFQMSFMYF